MITDDDRENKSQKVQNFLNIIGTTLKVLEEGTPWANRVQLCIGLVKEAIKKDIKEVELPLAF